MTITHFTPLFLESMDEDFPNLKGIYIPSAPLIFLFCYKKPHAKSKYTQQTCSLIPICFLHDYCLQITNMYVGKTFELFVELCTVHTYKHENIYCVQRVHNFPKLLYVIPFISPYKIHVPSCTITPYPQTVTQSLPIQ